MAYVNLGQVVYPVGSVYMSYTSTSPASLFGGNWTAITGHFPYFNNGTSTGGSNSISHSHGLANTGFAKIRYDWSGGSPNIQIDKSSCRWMSSTGVLYEWYPSSMVRYKEGELGYNDRNIACGLTGNTNNSSINNMPAYQTFYAWRRTS